MHHDKGVLIHQLEACTRAVRREQAPPQGQKWWPRGKLRRRTAPALARSAPGFCLCPQVGMNPENSFPDHQGNWTGCCSCGRCFGACDAARGGGPPVRRASRDRGAQRAAGAGALLTCLHFTHLLPNGTSFTLLFRGCRGLHVRRLHVALPGFGQSKHHAAL